VTLGLLMRKGITMREAVTYWIAQVIGGIVADALLKLMVSGFGGATDETGALGTNEYGKTVSLGGAMVVEVVMTFLLVLVVLLVTSRAAAPGFAGLAIGLVLTVIHLVGIPLDGTSVNPARSIGPALFNGGTPLCSSSSHWWAAPSPPSRHRCSRPGCPRAISTLPVLRSLSRDTLLRIIKTDGDSQDWRRTRRGRRCSAATHGRSGVDRTRLDLTAPMPAISTPPPSTGCDVASMAPGRGE
jgi:hypothetical protein